MKTAVSIPDNIFNDGEKTAAQLGYVRSQLYALALKEFNERHSHENITQKLNEFYSDNSTQNEISELGIHQLREATQNDTW